LEKGTHEELLAAHGLYYKLYTIQQNLTLISAENTQD
jgi:ABC-type multidrug transport system fused ATPase/permease subunit